MNKLQVYNLFKNKKRLKTGMLITFEGLDGSGKNTHVNNVAKYLEGLGFTAPIISFPEYERTIGKVIASYLKGEYGDIHNVPHELVCIAYAADRVRLKDQIQNSIENGHIVLADRYTYSNLFTAAKMPKDKQAGFIDWIEDMEFSEMKIVKPDYNFYLYVDPKISIEQIKARGKRDYQEGKEDIHENNDQLLKDVSETYFNFAKDKPNWKLIDQMKNGKQKSLDKVFENIKKEIDDILVKRELI
ncbi:Thymidylate kinase [compost metagenome]